MKFQFDLESKFLIKIMVSRYLELSPDVLHRFGLFTGSFLNFINDQVEVTMSVPYSLQNND